MFETSETTTKLDAALCKVQAQVKPVLKEAKNPYFNSKYATLASVWEAIKEALEKNEVNITQWPLESSDNKVKIMTRIAHGGEWMRGTFSIPVAKQDPQGHGSAITYARRFTLSAALGICPEDDDANLASNPKPPQPKQIPNQVQVKPPLTQYRENLDRVKTDKDLNSQLTRLKDQFEKPRP